jgi:hypothetical protein
LKERDDSKSTEDYGKSLTKRKDDLKQSVKNEIAEGSQQCTINADTQATCSKNDTNNVVAEIKGLGTGVEHEPHTNSIISSVHTEPILVEDVEPETNIERCPQTVTTMIPSPPTELIREQEIEPEINLEGGPQTATAIILIPPIEQVTEPIPALKSFRKPYEEFIPFTGKGKYPVGWVQHIKECMRFMDACKDERRYGGIDSCMYEYESLWLNEHHMRLTNQGIKQISPESSRTRNQDRLIWTHSRVHQRSAWLRVVLISSKGTNSMNVKYEYSWIQVSFEKALLATKRRVNYKYRRKMLEA